jgi:hypothetical protein
MTSSLSTCNLLASLAQRHDLSRATRPTGGNLAGIPTTPRKSFGKNLRVFVLTLSIARELATTADLIQRMQGIVLLGIFLRVTPFRESGGLSDEQIFAGVEKSLRKYFGKRGERVVQDNLTAVKRGYTEVSEIPRGVMNGEALWSKKPPPRCRCHAERSEAKLM